jgi:hypothetical protein
MPFRGLTCSFWAKTRKENCKDHKQKRIGWGEESGGEVEGGEGGDDLLGFEGDGDDQADEAEDVAFVVFAVGSLVMPERGSVETRYWSGSWFGTHSRAERLPRR